MTCTSHRERVEQVARAALVLEIRDELEHSIDTCRRRH